jgi:hypothetical protein
MARKTRMLSRCSSTDRRAAAEWERLAKHLDLVWADTVLRQVLSSCRQERVVRVSVVQMADSCRSPLHRPHG